MNCHEFWNTIPELGDLEGSRHLLECPACAARMSRHRELEAGFRAVAAGFRRVEAPPRVEARLRSAFREQTGRENRAPSRRWIPVVTWAAAFAAMFALATFLVRERQPEAARPPVQRTIELAMLQPQADSDGFIPLPNSAGLTASDAAGDAADEDDVNLVRVAVPRSAMIALGLDVSADRAEELVEADVMLGSNGMARAVRFLD
jgi:anti-sigma factor RsiW